METPMHLGDERFSFFLSTLEMDVFSFTVLSWSINQFREGGTDVLGLMIKSAMDVA